MTPKHRMRETQYHYHRLRMERMTPASAINYVMRLIQQGELHTFEAQALLDEPRPAQLVPDQNNFVTFTISKREEPT
jgi:hypothetical protein